jgi:type II secretory pathway predicted ATPase ExeA
MCVVRKTFAVKTGDSDNFSKYLSSSAELCNPLRFAVTGESYQRIVHKIDGNPQRIDNLLAHKKGAYSQKHI